MEDSYEGREQSAAKHLILKSYLEKLAYKIAFFGVGTLNYIDGFAGPWESQTTDLSDTSPSLALQTLLEVKEGLAKHDKTIDVRAFFVSPKRKGAEQLRALQARFPAAAIEVVEQTFESSLDRARKFAAAGRDPFAFIFIDHTGWTGFRLQEITPLLQQGHNEVLINFMTGHITRFIDTPDSRYETSFDELFGGALDRDAWRSLKGLDREDRIVDTYCQRILEAGKYRHCVSSVILNPTSNRTHFHLVYGTHSDEGLVTFRKIEREALEFQRNERADAQQRNRIKRTGQAELFAFGPAPHTYEDELRERYRNRAFEALDALVTPSGVAWDDLLIAGLRIPMIADSDVKGWLKGLQARGAVQVLGLTEREKVPKRGKKHRIRRLP
jgi:three-Cys-motif partner protein